MESGALSEEGFPEFAKEAVLFVHITTLIEGRKHDKLLSEIGGAGFPHVVAMDPAGKVIGVLHWEKRTVDGCRELMKDAKTFVELREKAEKGDNAAKIAYFPRALKLDLFKFPEAKAYLAGLKNVPAEAKKEIDGLLDGLEVRTLWDEINQAKDPAKKSELQKSAGKKFLEMEKAGRIPSGDDDFAKMHVVILDYAELEKNIPVYEKSLEAIKDRFGDNLNRRFLAAKEKVLENLKAEKDKKEENKDK